MTMLCFFTFLFFCFAFPFSFVFILIMYLKYRGSKLITITRNTFCRTRSLSNATFSFLSRDVHPVQNLLLCTKFHEFRMIFHWYMAIYRFYKWRPSAMLELFYHHTIPPTKSLLLAAAACQISCQSDTKIWRYSYLNFSHIWVKCTADYRILQETMDKIQHWSDVWLLKLKVDKCKVVS